MGRSGWAGRGPGSGSPSCPQHLCDIIFSSSEKQQPQSPGMRVAQKSAPRPSPEQGARSGPAHPLSGLLCEPSTLALLPPSVPKHLAPLFFRPGLFHSAQPQVLLPSGRPPRSAPPEPSLSGGGPALRPAGTALKNEGCLCSPCLMAPCLHPEDP